MGIKKKYLLRHKKIAIFDFDLKSAVWQFPLINIYFSATGEKRSDLGLCLCLFLGTSFILFEIDSGRF